VLYRQAITLNWGSFDSFCRYSLQYELTQTAPIVDSSNVKYIVLVEDAMVLT
jgi:hypothetical protein